MLKRYPPLLAIPLSLALAACGSTRHFIEEPSLTVDGTDKPVSEAAAQLFDGSPPYQVRLCEADPVSKACKPGSHGIRAHGVGGLFIPLVLNVNGLNISQQTPSPSGYAIEAAVQSKADGVPPLCRNAHGEILVKENKTMAVQFKSFYCNWLAVGNVLVNAELSIDLINPRDRVFNGFYKLTFHGTGNVSGSGYYRAEIVPSGKEELTSQTRDQSSQARLF